MKQHTSPEELERETAEAEGDSQEQAQEEADRNRRSFLTRAAIGVAGAAGMLAIGAESTHAATAKSKILERVKSQMAAQAPLLEGGDDAYIKNSHSLYLKQDIE